MATKAATRKPAAKKAAVKKPAPKVGRPQTAVPKQMAEAICQWISDGKTLREFCRLKGHPHYNTVYCWLEKDNDFAVRFARAREIGEDQIAQECLHIADTQMIGETTKITERGVEVTKEDMLGHRKLQVDTRLKLLAKWNPKRWGDKVDVTQNTTVQGKVDLSLSDIEAYKLLLDQ